MLHGECDDQSDHYITWITNKLCNITIYSPLKFKLSISKDR